jgi:hypothetical protein
MLRASSTFANFVLAASSRPWPAMMVPSWRTRSSHTCPNWRNDDRSCAICTALCRRALPASWLGSRTGRACPVRDLVVDFRSRLDQALGLASHAERMAREAGKPRLLPLHSIASCRRADPLVIVDIRTLLGRRQVGGP